MHDCVAKNGQYIATYVVEMLIKFIFVTGFEKAGFHAHNSSTHFSPSHGSVHTHINKQFRQVLVLNVAQNAFAVACF